ncbi:MAG: recombinase family protein [Saccharofermentanales bacterium]
MENAREITIIPTKAVRFSMMPSGKQEKRKVAAYARVSTDTEEQLSSYDAQVDYYSDYIKSRVDWEFVKVYADEGISATSTKRRDGFNLMIADAMAGRIDLIVTKSVSRFARNTVDTLVTIRKLKDKGVEVFFEKENIYTMDSKGELLITIMSSMAQEESRSISENVTWGQRKRFADGKVNIPYGQFLGYEKGEDGFPKIVESQAKTVRLIYKLLLDGKTTSGIARHLTALGIPTPSGKKNWQKGTVGSILSNEKYKGDALLQKKFTVDFLTKKQKVNEGEVPQYYVQNSHPAIVSADIFDMVQIEMKRRIKLGRNISNKHCFSSMIVCSECGAYFGSKVWHSTSKYKRTIWQCNAKFDGEKKCRTPHLHEEDIKKEFIKALNTLITNKEEILENCEMMKKMLADTSAVDNEIQKLKSEVDAITELLRQCVEENAHLVMDLEVYQKKYDGLVERYEKETAKLDKTQNTRKERLYRVAGIDSFVATLKAQDVIATEFDEEIWNLLVDKILVGMDGRMEFVFRDGL